MFHTASVSTSLSIHDVEHKNNDFEAQRLCKLMDVRFALESAEVLFGVVDYFLLLLAVNLSLLEINPDESFDADKSQAAEKTTV